MGRPKKEQERTTVSLGKKTKELVQHYAEDRGIDFSAAVNVLLYDAMQRVERGGGDDDNTKPPERTGTK